MTKVKGLTLALVLVPRLWRSTTGVRVEISMSSLRQGVSQASGSTPLALGAGISTIKTQREKTELVRQKSQLVIQPMKLWPKIKLT